MTNKNEWSIKSVFTRFYHDAVQVMINPKAFYESMPTEKNQEAIFSFLIPTALIYSVAATFFAHDQQLVFLVSFFFNGSLMPFILAAMLYLIMLLMQSGIGYGLALGITVYANTAILFAWIPGMAPFSELFRYYLMGVGIVKVTGLNGWKAFFVLLGMGGMLLLLIYGLQMLISH